MRPGTRAGMGLEIRFGTQSDLSSSTLPRPVKRESGSRVLKMMVILQTINVCCHATIPDFSLISNDQSMPRNADLRLHLPACNTQVLQRFLDRIPLPVKWRDHSPLLPCVPTGEGKTTRTPTNDFLPPLPLPPHHRIHRICPSGRFSFPHLARRGVL